MSKSPIDPALSYLGIEFNNEVRLTLKEFWAKTQDHLTPIIEAHPQLHSATIIFEGDCIIRPIQCKLFIKLLRQVNTHTTRFCKLLNEVSQLPLVFTVLRYRLLSILHRIEEQIRRLTNSIDDYRTFAMISSPSEQRRRQQIYNSFKDVLKHISDISQQVEILKDEVQFHERKLASLNEERSIINIKSTDTSDTYTPPPIL